jgi:hypothetical protein
MPTAIIAGLPPDIQRRVLSYVKENPSFAGAWTIIWQRSKSHMPGISPSQVREIQEHAASNNDGSHILIFRSGTTRDEAHVMIEIAPYFRFRWLEHKILKSIPHRIQDFLEAIGAILEEEAIWSQTVRPRDESSCLLLPSCSFVAGKSVRHVWEAASQAGIERIKLAANACAKFKEAHWLSDTRGKSRSRAWIDDTGIIFDHRGQRHARAPFPRSWKFSYEMEPGFHYDAQSLDSRSFKIVAADGTRHSALPLGHVNVDPHGVVIG